MIERKSMYKKAGLAKTQTVFCNVVGIESHNILG